MFPPAVVVSARADPALAAPKDGPAEVAPADPARAAATPAAAPSIPAALAVRAVTAVSASYAGPEETDHAALFFLFGEGTIFPGAAEVQERASRSSSSRYSSPCARVQTRNCLRKMVSSFLRVEDSTLRLTASDR
jgi:hypothetical protein